MPKEAQEGAQTDEQDDGQAPEGQEEGQDDGQNAAEPQDSQNQDSAPETEDPQEP